MNILHDNEAGHKTEYNADGFSIKPIFDARAAALLTEKCLKPKLDVFDELLKVVMNRIKIAGTWAQSDLLFTVPMHFVGLPRFDSTWMLYLLKAKLDTAGYYTILYQQYQALYISWHHMLFKTEADQL